MESSKPLIREFTAKLKRASLLWLQGFGEACCFHRVVLLFLRSTKLFIKTGQCFLLNGFIFLGSIFVLNSVVVPTLEWILPDQFSNVSSQELSSSYGSILKFYSLLRSGLIALFYVFWFYPMQVFSLVLSNLWYNEIAKLGYAAMGKTKHNITEPTSQSKGQTTSSNTAQPTEKAAGLGGVVIGIGELVYSFLLLNIFFLEVYATGLIPYIGKALNFLLLSWMYAYYSFEYKWNFSEVTLDRRLDFFESNWAFFLGFGSPCTLAIFFFSRLVSYGVMATLFPLFVLTATSTNSEQEIFLQRTKWKCVGLGRLPIFYLADTISMRILLLIPLSSRKVKEERKDL